MLGAAHARAQANLTFSGGLGKPLVLTLNAPVTYAVTTAGAKGSAPSFDFQGVGNFGDAGSVNGNITYTIDGGSAQAIGLLRSGFSGGSLATTDAYIFGLLGGVAVGDLVVLNAGTLTTPGNFAGVPPASGSFQTFLIDGNGNKLDAVNGVSVVPEPSTWALLLGVGAGLLGLGTSRHRRVRCA